MKEITNDAALVASTKKIETLEAMNTFLKSEKDELVLQIATKNKKIEILESRVKELTEMKTNVKNGVCSEADDHINELDEELAKTKHKVTELEVSGIAIVLKTYHREPGALRDDSVLVKRLTSSEYLLLQLSLQAKLHLSAAACRRG